MTVEDFGEHGDRVGVIWVWKMEGRILKIHELDDKESIPSVCKAFY